MTMTTGAGPTVRAGLTIELLKVTAVATRSVSTISGTKESPCRDLIPDQQAGQVGEESAAREPVPCPVGYGWRRLTSAVCWEYARKLLAGQRFWLVMGSQLVVCKSIA
jgi:hypothetical protein